LGITARETLMRGDYYVVWLIALGIALLISILTARSNGQRADREQAERLKERVRNPFAHGGVENDKGSLFVHIPSIGAIPGNFTQIKNRVRFNFLPLEADDHAEACSLFDELDALMRSGPLAGAFSFVENGVAPSFDEKSLKEYAKLAVDSAEEREHWIDYWHQENDRHDNMDY
jgi:hypothetical protein